MLEPSDLLVEEGSQESISIGIKFGVGLAEVKGQELVIERKQITRHELIEVDQVANERKTSK